MRHLQGRQRLRVVGFGILITALLSGVTGATASGAARIPAYGWPVQPFDQPHPIRSTFGDPRTSFDGPPTATVLYTGRGSFSFHTGIDIVVPDRTPVYPVRSGTAKLSGGRTVTVQSGDGSSWQYWHIVPAVTTGERVVAYTTILGRVRTGYGHVHLAEFNQGRPINPLAPGHLTPYSDKTSPRIGAIEIRRPGSPDEQLPELVRGTIEPVVSVFDTPRPTAPGVWAAMPTAPALIRWRIERRNDGHTVLPEQRAFDVRERLPSNRSFWHYYARGTRQNMATFKQHRYWYQEGVFLFRLGIVDTHNLPDGIYSLIATAHDIRGNSTERSRTFLVWNRPGWPPVTPQS